MKNRPRIVVKTMKQTLRIVLVSIFTLSCLTGCGNYKELNKLSFISSLGIDRTKDGSFKVTLQVVNPGELATTQGGGGKSIPVFNYTSTGKTITEAARNSTKKFSRRVFYGQLAIIVVGEKAARQGIQQVIDLLIRDPVTPTLLPIVIAQDSTAQEILDLLTPINYVTGEEIASKLKNTLQTLGENNYAEIYELADQFQELGKEMAISGVRIVAKNPEMDTKGNLEKIRPAITYVGDVALFKHEKLVGWLKKKEGRPYLMITNKLKQTNFAVPCGKNQYNSLKVLGQRTKSDVKFQRGKPVINVRSKVVVFLNEANCQLDLRDLHTVSKLEKETSKVVKTEILQSVGTAQKYKSDVFGFGAMLHRSNLKQWKKHKDQWDHLFADAEVNVDVKVIMRRAGVIGDPLR